MTRTATLQADLGSITDSVVGARTVVALPPSDLDPSIFLDGTGYDAITVYDATTVYEATFLYDEMRVYVNGSLTVRAYDPEVS